MSNRYRMFFFFSSRRRHTRSLRDWSSDVCSSDLDVAGAFIERLVLALTGRGHGVQVVAPADGGRGGRELRHRVPVTRVRYAPARWETLAYRGTMAEAARSPLGFVAAASLVAR